MAGNKSGDFYDSAPDGGDSKTTQGDSNPPVHSGGGGDEGNTLASNAFGRSDTTLQRYVMIRPPPPPPLTPPARPRPLFSLGEHKTSGLGTSPDLGSSFIHQPNPDYHGSTSTAETSPETFGSPAEEQGRSFSSPLPINIPPPLQHHNSDPSGPGASVDGVTMSDNAGFSPSSYPPTSPFLPPAPFNIDGLPPSMGVEVQGEVLSATDGFGAPWTRHTRVYGGGVCLACAASGGEGGFYGATAIRPDGH